MESENKSSVGQFCDKYNGEKGGGDFARRQKIQIFGVGYIWECPSFPLNEIIYESCDTYQIV